MNRYTTLSAMALVVAMMAGTSLAQTSYKLSGSKHDLRTYRDSSGALTNVNEICAPCHAVHNGNMAVEEGRFLWNHSLSTQNFTLYSTAHPDTRYGTSSSANPVLDDGSKMCLSCHDGVVSLDAYGGAMGTNRPMQGSAAIGKDNLTNDHPIGIGYPGATMTAGVVTWVAKSGYFDPTTDLFKKGPTAVYAGGAAVKLVEIEGGRAGLSCITCHTPHSNQFNYLRMSNAGSALCLQCHDK